MSVPTIGNNFIQLLRDPETTTTDQLVEWVLSNGVYLVHVPDDASLLQTVEVYLRTSKLQCTSVKDSSISIPQLVYPMSLPEEFGRNHAEMIGADGSNIMSGDVFADVYDADLCWVIFLAKDKFFIQRSSAWESFEERTSASERKSDL